MGVQIVCLWIWCVYVCVCDTSVWLVDNRAKVASREDTPKTEASNKSYSPQRTEVSFLWTANFMQSDRASIFESAVKRIGSITSLRTTFSRVPANMQQGQKGSPNVCVFVVYVVSPCLCDGVYVCTV